MGAKLGTTLAIVFMIILPIYGTTLIFSTLQCEEMEVSAVGEFAKIEIRDMEFSEFYISIDSEFNNFTYNTGVFPVDRILEIKVFWNNEVDRLYDAYTPLEQNVYDIGNLSITLNGIYEGYGVINKTEIPIAIWTFFILVFAGLFITLILEEQIKWKYSRWKSDRSIKKKKEKKKKEKSSA